MLTPDTEPNEVADTQTQDHVQDHTIRIDHTLEADHVIDIEVILVIATSQMIITDHQYGIADLDHVVDRQIGLGDDHHGIDHLNVRQFAIDREIDQDREVEYHVIDRQSVTDHRHADHAIAHQSDEDHMDDLQYANDLSKDYPQDKDHVREVDQGIR